MTNIEQRALALAIEVREDAKMRLCPDPTLLFGNWEALCRAIEQCEAQAAEIERLRVEAKAQYDRGYYDGCTRSIVQSDALREAVIEECAKALEADAIKCDCAALEERECACGAWNDYKTITSARAVEIVRALQEQSK